MTPQTEDGDPDLAFMKTFIKAVEKLVIKYEVLLADKKLAQRNRRYENKIVAVKNNHQSQERVAKLFAFYHNMMYTYPVGW